MKRLMQLSLSILAVAAAFHLAVSAIPPSHATTPGHESGIAAWWPVIDEKAHTQVRDSLFGATLSAHVPYPKGVVVLYESGHVSVYMPGIAPQPLPDHEPPIPVSEIRLWHPMMVIARNGDLWQKADWGLGKWELKRSLREASVACKETEPAVRAADRPRRPSTDEQETAVSVSVRLLRASTSDYVGKRVRIGPLRVFVNSVGEARFNTQPSTGPTKYDRDRDVTLDVFYDRLPASEKAKCIQLSSVECPVIYAIGIVELFANSDRAYLRAEEIEFKDD